MPRLVIAFNDFNSGMFDSREEIYAQQFVSLAHDDGESYPWDAAMWDAEEKVHEELGQLQRAFKQTMAKSRANPAMRLLVAATIVQLYGYARREMEYREPALIYDRFGAPVSEHALCLQERVMGQVNVQGRRNIPTAFDTVNRAMDIMAGEEIEPYFCIGHSFWNKGQSFIDAWRPVMKSTSKVDTPTA